MDNKKKKKKITNNETTEKVLKVGKHKKKIKKNLSVFIEAAKKRDEVLDHVLLLVPFEKKYFDKEGVQSTFTGHPLLEEQSKSKIDISQIIKDNKIMLETNRIEYKRKLTDEFEKEILEELNKLGIGAMGMGGTKTVLAVHIEKNPCHIASLPVSVNVQCHSSRHSHITL